MKKIVFIVAIFLVGSLGFTKHYVIKVKLKNGTTDTFAVADVSKIYFDLNTSIADESKLMHKPGSFMLLPNYPNPFNPSTIIQYDIPKAGKVEINIYDINGKLIKTLVNQSHTPGLQKAEWDGKNEAGKKAASGHYIYSVKFEHTILSEKMILLK